MRLFEGTSFYILMVIETVMDTRFFIILFIMVVATFANAIMIVDKKQTVLYQESLLADPNTTEEAYVPLIPEFFHKADIMDAWFNQYLLGLGEFVYVEHEGPNASKNLYLFYFIVATLITNITFLNVLIAIVNDTYARITNGKERYAL